MGIVTIAKVVAPVIAIVATLGVLTGRLRLASSAEIQDDIETEAPINSQNGV